MQQIFKATENADIIGLGNNHVLSKSNLEFRSQLAEKIYNIQLNENLQSNQTK